jgi:TPR repeat protein
MGMSPEKMISNALSVDPSKRTQTGSTQADMIGVALTNKAMGNHPSLGARALFGSGNAAQNLAQHWSDQSVRGATPSIAGGGIAANTPGTAGPETTQMGLDFFRLGDYAMAVQCFRRSSDQGDPAASYHLGMCYREGRGVAKCPVTARGLLLRAAQGGVPLAMYTLAVDMLSDPSPKLAEGLAWMVRAAELSDPDACTVAGCHLFNGIACNKDIPRALKYLRIGANAGKLDAMYWLGRALADNGAAPEGVQWLYHAGSQGQPDAAIWLGLLYSRGRPGIPVNPPLAAQFTMQAANDGDGDACAIIAEYCETGYGIPANGERARHYYRIAAARASSESVRRGCSNRLIALGG